MRCANDEEEILFLGSNMVDVALSLKVELLDAT